jgi:hypothetical protein
VVPNTIQNAALRWKIWTGKIEQTIKDVNFMRMRYEDLITSPEIELRKVMDFIGEKYEPSMLNYANVKHDYPQWEWGSTDVKKSKLISNSSTGRWAKELSPEIISEIETMIGDVLLRYGYGLSTGVSNGSKLGR